MSKQPKERLDKILVDKCFFETKSKAQAAIMAGNVKINGETITKAGQQISPAEDMDIAVESLPYVSRGGYKLEKAIKEFNIDLKDKSCIDAGASTGGFTDSMLQNGAKQVYAIDVGYGQLAWKLRSDERVVVIERTNIRSCTPEEIYKSESAQRAEFAAMDLSFISITKVLKNIKGLLTPEKHQIVALIKPQFEAGKDQVPKSGVVKDRNVHFEVIKRILDLSSSIELYPTHLTFSPIKGPAGNIEYLVCLTNEKNYFDDDKINSIIDEAQGHLNNNLNSSKTL